MIKGACHCGDVQYEFDDTPEFGTKCNCSICRKLGAVWIYSDPSKVNITGDTIAYSWGDRNLSFHSCPKCGATSHWALLVKGDRIAVNVMLSDPKTINALPVRQFDGADSWKFLD